MSATAGGNNWFCVPSFLLSFLLLSPSLFSSTEFLTEQISVSIDLLREYCTALISSPVKGKIDVQDLGKVTTSTDNERLVGRPR